MTDNQETKRIAEELVSAFKSMWAEHDYCTSNRQNLNKLLKKLRTDTAGLISLYSEERKGSYVIRREVSGDIVLLSDFGEVRFFNLDLARECKKILGDTYQVLQIIE